MSVTDTTVFVFPVGYGRNVVVDRAPNAQCDRCRCHAPCLYIDSSDGEYGGGCFCRECLLSLIDTTPIVPCRHEMRHDKGRDYCRNCGDSAEWILKQQEVANDEG